MSYLNILATSVLLTLIGLLFGALALLVSAATGSVRTGLWSQPAWRSLPMW